MSQMVAYRSFIALALALLVALPALSAFAQDSGERSMRSDPSGDVHTCPLITCVPTGVPAYVDIVAAGILEETDDHLVAAVEFAGQGGTPEEVLSSGPERTYLQMYFRFDTDPGSGFSLWTARHNGGAWEDVYLYRYTCADRRCDGDSRVLSASEVTLRDDPLRLEVPVPKDWLWYGASKRALREGDLVSQVDAWVSHYSFEIISSYDYAYGDIHHEVKRAAPNSALRLGFLAPEPEQAESDDWGDDREAADRAFTEAAVALEAGRTKALPLRVDNLLTVRRIANLTGSVVDAAGAPVAGWAVKLPANLLVDAGGSVTVNALVTAPADGRHGDGGELRVEGTFLGGDGSLRGIARRPAVVAEGYAVGTARLTLHTGPTPSGEPFLEPVFGDAYHDKYGTFSPLAEDDRYPDVPVDMAQGTLEVATDTPTPAEMVLGSGDLVVTLHLDSDRERDIGLEVMVGAWGPDGRDVLFDAEHETHTVPEGTSDLTLRFPLSKDGEVLPEGSRFGMYVWGSELGVLNALPGVTIAPGDSWIEFPVAEVRSNYFKAGSGAFLPQINPAKGQSREEFTNPATTVAFNLTLVNGGAYEDTIRLSVNGTKSGWRTSIVPGTSFKLAPGRSVNVGAEVTPPAGAAEGEILELHIRATSASDKEASQEVAVRVIATQAIQLQERSFEPSLEAKNATVREEKGSPAAAGPAAAGPLLLAALALRAGLRRPARGCGRKRF